MDNHIRRMVLCKKKGAEAPRELRQSGSGGDIHQRAGRLSKGIDDGCQSTAGGR